jgi:hypothetical protein
MSARKVYLSSLTPGRCFAHAPAEAELDEGEGRVTGARTIMGPEAVWKVIEVGDVVAAENARGERDEFDPKRLVAEVLRGGFDRLVERVGDPGDALFRG